MVVWLLGGYLGVASTDVDRCFRACALQRFAGGVERERHFSYGIDIAAGLPDRRSSFFPVLPVIESIRGQTRQAVGTTVCYAEDAGGEWLTVFY